MTINERIAELEAMQKDIAKEIAELKEEAKGIALFSDYEHGKSYCYYVPSGEVGADYCSEKDLMSVFNIFPIRYEDKVKDFYNHVIKINNLLMQYKLALCPDHEPDWNNRYICKWYVFYNYETKLWQLGSVNCNGIQVVYFDRDSALKVADDLNRRGIEP